MLTDTDKAKQHLAELKMYLYKAVASGALAHLAITKHEATTEDMRVMSLEIAKLLGKATNNVAMLAEALERDTDNA